jgi:hypothetical protein
MHPKLNGFALCAVAGALAMAGCRSATAIATPNQPSAPSLVAISISPPSPTVYTGGSQQFTASAQYSSGGTGSVTVTWAATGGSISSIGLFTADSTAGSYLVSAAQQGGSLVGTTTVNVSALPQGGNYIPVAAQDWSTYADKASLAGLFGVEGWANKTYDPLLPSTAFYDLVSESVPDGNGGMKFGKAVRYLGDPALNTTDFTRPGRIAVHKVKFADLDDVWVRQYARFSTNWTTMAVNPSGASAYKMMFFRFDGAGFRLNFGMVSRNEGMELGQGPSGSRPGAIEAALPWDNHVPVSPADGARGMDAWPMIKAPNFQGPPFKAGGDGDGEWYERVMHFKKVDVMVMQGTVAKRRVTLGGVWNPGPWVIIARQVTHTGDPTVEYIRPVISYEMGVNRNKQWDDVMWLDWGKYDVVNGALYPNPFNVPGVP